MNEDLRLNEDWDWMKIEIEWRFERGIQGSNLEWKDNYSYWLINYHSH